MCLCVCEAVSHGLSIETSRKKEGSMDLFYGILASPERAIVGLFVPPDKVLKIFLPSSAFVAFPQINASLEAIGGSRKKR